MFLVFGVLALPLFNSEASDLRLKNLLTEYAQTPLGIDVVRPSFSWQMDADQPGFRHGKTVFGEKVVDTQPSYALPLAFNIVSEKRIERVVDNFVHTITRSGITDQNIETPPYSLMTGFIGTAWISKVLSDYGRTDLAYRLLQQTDYPSWLYPVKQGATTIWERLNSYTHTVTLFLVFCPEPMKLR